VSLPAWGLAPPQEAPAAKVPAQALQAEPEESEPVRLMTDAERVIGIERAIERDEQRLEELKVEQGLFEESFEHVTHLILIADRSIVDLEDEIAALPPDATEQERSGLEDSRSRVQVLAEILRKLSEIAFTAESTSRQQIVALEKKIAKEYRILERLSGLESANPSVPVAVTPSAEAPSGGPAPETPGMQPADEVSTPSERWGVRTTDQLEALQAFERAQRDLVAAERALVRFVIEKELVQTQVRLEERLLDAAREAADLLLQARDIAQAEAEGEDLTDAVADELRVDESVVRRVEQMIENNRAVEASSSEELESLARRLPTLDVLQLRLAEDVRRELDEVKEARKHLIWVESPFHPQNLLRWLSERGPRVLMVIVISALLLGLVRVAARRTARVLIGAGRGTRVSRENRADTIGLSVQSVASVVILVGGTLLVFQAAGVDVKTILGGAAILGVAFAFGAQHMMRDYFAGIMILLEDQYGLNDLVTISGVTGRVERINMRTTVLRDIEGRVHFIPNGDVKLVTNRTYEWGRAVLEIPVRYHENVNRVMEVVLEICEEARADPQWQEYLTDEPVMLGVDKFTEYGVVIKFMQETRPDKIFPVRRELMRRIKDRFDELDIEIGVPQRIIGRSERES
jgi:small conductance mechanosensitive channel